MTLSWLCMICLQVKHLQHQFLSSNALYLGTGLSSLSLLRQQPQQKQFWSRSSNLHSFRLLNNNKNNNNNNKFQIVSKLYLSSTTDLDSVDNNNDSNNKQNEQSQKTSSLHLLPRLYVGPADLPPLVLNTNDGNDTMNDKINTSNNVPVIKKDSIIPLNSNQIHYITNVMRMFGNAKGNRRRNRQNGELNKKKRLSRYSYQDYDPCVRVFDGYNGEWLAQLHLLEDQENQQQKRKRSTQTIDNNSIVAQCHFPIRLQNHLKELDETENISIRVADNYPTSSSVNSGNANVNTISKQMNVNKQQQFRSILCFALPNKKDRYKWILEKGTELGMDGYMLIATDRTQQQAHDDDNNNKKNLGVSLQKIQSYVIEAAEQCERLSIPQFVASLNNQKQQQQQQEQQQKQQTLYSTTTTYDDDDTNETPVAVTPLSTLLEHTCSSLLSSDEDKKIKNRNDNIKFLICRERSDTSIPIMKALDEIMSESNNPYGSGSSNNEKNSIASETSTSLSPVTILFLVGPEGGWSPEEENLFDQLQLNQKLNDENINKNHNSKIIFNVSLGSNVLRSETAIITAMAAYTLAVN